MSEKGSTADISALLYVFPFAAAGVYAMVLWVQAGISATLPSSVYLTVTRDPYLFVLGSSAVLAGVVMEVRATQQVQRTSKLTSLSGTVQTLAGASLVLSVLCALYANGLDLGGAASDFVVGRYGIVFPALLFLLSYLLRIQFQFSALLGRRFLGVLAMLLVPVALYGLGKLKSGADLPVALLLLILGVMLFLWPGKGKPEQG